MTPPKAKVFRYSELGLTPDGERRLYFRTYNADRAKVTMEALMLEGEVIEPSEVIIWCQRAGLTPSAHEAEELAYVLNIIRVTKPKKRAFPTNTDSKKWQKLSL